MANGLAYISIIVAMSVGGSAHAASFDCKKAAGRIEQLICRDPDLNSFDSQLQGAYAGALDRSAHPERITQGQRAWLKERDACTDVKCLSTIYQRRIAGLSNVSDEPAICSGATTPEVNACGEEYAARADRELTRYLAVARRRIADASSENSNPSTSERTLAALEASQKTWEAFRKAECEAVFEWWREGTIRGAMFEGCMRSLTKARTEQVWETWLSFVDDTPPLMPKPAAR